MKLGEGPTNVREMWAKVTPGNKCSSKANPPKVKNSVAFSYRIRTESIPCLSVQCYVKLYTTNAKLSKLSNSLLVNVLSFLSGALKEAA